MAMGINRSESGLAESVGAVVRFWNRFWFSPADPTPLAVLRILCGLMVLYVHIAYSYDLMNFHGPHAWLDKQIIDEYGHEAPSIGPRNSWSSIPVATATPEETEYFKTWGLYPNETLSGRYPQFAKWFKGHPFFSIWFHVTDPAWIWICHGIILF